MLETPRLILRQWKETNLKPFAALNQDSVVREFFPSLLTEEESREQALICQKEIATEGFSFFAAEVKGSSDFIGMIGLRKVGFDALFTPAIEVGWRLAKEHWGKGYATEGARAAVHFGFDVLHLKEIVSFTTKANARSIRVMEKIGISYVCDFHHPKLAEGHPLRPHVLYKISAAKNHRYQ